MRFHGDLTQATPVMRDVQVYDASTSGLIAGQAMGGVATNATEGCGGAIDISATTLADFIGVTLQTPPVTIAVMAAGTDYYAKLVINPMAYFLTEYATGSSGTVTTASTSGEVLNDTGINTSNQGGWVYCNGPTTDTAYGNLFRIGAQTSTTTLTNVTGAAYDDELGATTTSTTYIMLQCPMVGGVSGGAIDLDTTLAKFKGDPTGETGGAGIVLDNYVSHSRFPMEPLRTANHSGKKIGGATFYGDLFFCDRLMGGNDTLP